MNLSYTKTLSRRIFLSFLVFVLLLAVSAIFVRSSISKKLDHIVKQSNSMELDEHTPARILLLLQQAEDDFQTSLLTSGSPKSADYKAKLLRAFAEMDTLLNKTADTSHLTAEQNGKVRTWYSQKLLLSADLSQLKHQFDSLLTVYAAFDEEMANSKDKGLLVTVRKEQVKDLKHDTDTIKTEIKAKKKGLFSRLKDAISNKEEGNGSKSIVQIENNRRTNQKEITTTEKLQQQNQQVYAKHLQQLQTRNLRLMYTQQQLIRLNSKISNELQSIINKTKSLNYTMTGEFKDLAFKSYQETTGLINQLYLAALFLVLIFAVILIVLILKLSKSEQLLRKENDRAVVMAQQKMDLLLHMSHEIRNPLTSIKGFLYVFSKTELSAEQSDMLSSIRLSSDMLLGTVNDVLDAAKMENSEFKLNQAPFHPDVSLRSVVESMEFSAQKKGLPLVYQFDGDKNILLKGDSFRLGQIMINLLSNAIKYTSQGHIVVKAGLTSWNGKQKLQVDITDTGAGISPEQQNGLFSKYYQTNSSKGKISTGLGLYICKQFVQLQEGEIWVKSKEGEGSTFSFSIPYGIETESSESLITDTIKNKAALLNGISILAVDDHEMNLRFLKMMTSKWNIDFHGAGSAKQALAMMQNIPVSVVLTDIQMPEMDGYELLKAIRESESPQQKVPVIAITGATGDNHEEELLRKGFSGVGMKPILESGLADLIFDVLNSKK